MTSPALFWRNFCWNFYHQITDERDFRNLTKYLLGVFHRKQFHQLRNFFSWNLNINFWECRQSCFIATRMAATALVLGESGRLRIVFPNIFSFDYYFSTFPKHIWGSQTTRRYNLQNWKKNLSAQTTWE